MFGKKVKTIVIIDGMRCEHCANKVKAAIAGIDSVKKVTVDLSKKEAIIMSGKKLDVNNLKKNIEILDYKVVDIIENC